MQSDARVLAALSALAPQISLFRYAVAGTLERARNTLFAESGPSRTRVTLGNFAAGRIDPDRFAMISSGTVPLDFVGRAVLERAAEVLDTIARGGDEQFLVDVPSGTAAGEAIRDRMADLGAVFGAASLVELVRRRTYDSMLHSSPLDGHPFEKWTAAERKLAPPLIVRLDGRDLDAFELAPLIDGCVRLILLVDEPCSPAPLARLISPGVFVAQSEDAKIVESVGDFEGPAVIAVMSGTEARFVHNPRAGSAMWQRFEISRMPDVPPRKSLGSRSAWQQREDLAHLKALVQPPVLSAGNGAAAPSDSAQDATEKLAAWLIGQAGFQGGMS